MKLDQVLVRPIISEKSTGQAKESKFTFAVSSSASKASIRQSVKRLFNVDPIDVKTIIVPGKTRRVFGKKFYTKSPKWKKAVVTLKKGQTISLFELGEKK